MFGFFRGSGAHRPSDRVRQALAQAGRAPGVPADAIEVLEMGGTYSGRQVTYFRAFDRASVTQRGVKIRGFADLDAHPDLVLGAGHVEKDGAVVLTGAPGASATLPQTRERADRAGHADDERFVFPADAPEGS